MEFWNIFAQFFFPKKFTNIAYFIDSTRSQYYTVHVKFLSEPKKFPIIIHFFPLSLSIILDTLEIPPPKKEFTNIVHFSILYPFNTIRLPRKSSIFSCNFPLSKIHNYRPLLLSCTLLESTFLGVGNYYWLVILYSLDNSHHP